MPDSERWERWSNPCNSAFARDVFPEPVYHTLCEAFRQRIETSPPRRYKGYDARAYPFEEKDQTMFAPLFERAWLARLADRLDLSVLFEVDGALHHHPAKGRSGWIHNDYNPGWFHRCAAPGEVLLRDLSLCDYRSGRTAAGYGAPVERIRRLAGIYYLENVEDWSPEIGGTTNFYLAENDALDAPSLVIPPLNNSLVIFECTPFSFHSFIASQTARNSLIFWLHGEIADARQRWPDHPPVGW